MRRTAVKAPSSGKITTEELLQELAAARGPSGTGDTVEELANKLRWSRTRVIGLLKAAKRQGRLKVDYRPADGLDGRIYRQQLYQVTPKGRG